MAYHQTSEHDHDDHVEHHGYIAIGEARSEEDGQLACLTLFELGIPCELAHGESEVDELRRFLEGWSAGQRLFVKPQDAARALAAVGPRLAPTQIWTNETLYLEQCPTEHLFKILDFRDIWTKPWEEAALGTATRVLAARGIQYPPDGVSSWVLPATCLIFGIWGGPLAGLMLRWRIDKMRPTKEGGQRPHYDDKTRQRSDRCLLTVFIIWCAVVFAGMVFRGLHPD